MAVVSSLTFVIRAADQDNVRGRAVRRIFISNPAMKLAKLFTGDVVILSAASEISQEKVGLRLPSENGLPNPVLYLEAVRSRDCMAVIRASR